MGDEAAPHKMLTSWRARACESPSTTSAPATGTLEGDVADVMQTVRCPSAPRSVPTRCGGSARQVRRIWERNRRVGSVVSDKDSCPLSVDFLRIGAANCQSRRLIHARHDGFPSGVASRATDRIPRELSSNARSPKDGPPHVPYYRLQQRRDHRAVHACSCDRHEFWR